MAFSDVTITTQGNGFQENLLSMLEPWRETTVESMYMKLESSFLPVSCNIFVPLQSPPAYS